MIGVPRGRSATWLWVDPSSGGGALARRVPAGSVTGFRVERFELGSGGVARETETYCAASRFTMLIAPPSPNGFAEVFTSVSA